MILTNIFDNFLNLTKQLLNSFLTAFDHVQNATIPFSFVRLEPSNMKHELPLLSETKTDRVFPSGDHDKKLTRKSQETWRK